jgi:hypothetical protein
VRGLQVDSQHEIGVHWLSSTKLDVALKSVQFDGDRMARRRDFNDSRGHL